MAFSDDIAAMQAAVYARYGVAGTWKPGAGEPVPIVFLADEGDAVGLVGGLGRQVFSRAVFRARASEMAAQAPTATPAKGDILQIAGINLTVVEPPLRKDVRQSEWTLECEA